MVEQWTLNPCVGGSIPLGVTKKRSDLKKSGRCDSKILRLFTLIQLEYSLWSNCMAKKNCNHCGKYKDEEEFNWRYKALGIRHPTCRDCMSEVQKKYFQGDAHDRH